AGGRHHRLRRHRRCGGAGSAPADQRHRRHRAVPQARPEPTADRDVPHCRPDRRGSAVRVHRLAVGATAAPLSQRRIRRAEASPWPSIVWMPIRPRKIVSCSTVVRTVTRPLSIMTLPSTPARSRYSSALSRADPEEKPPVRLAGPAPTPARAASAATAWAWRAAAICPPPSTTHPAATSSIGATIAAISDDDPPRSSRRQAGARRRSADDDMPLLHRGLHRALQREDQRPGLPDAVPGDRPGRSSRHGVGPGLLIGVTTGRGRLEAVAFAIAGAGGVGTGTGHRGTVP